MKLEKNGEYVELPTDVIKEQTYSISTNNKLLKLLVHVTYQIFKLDCDNGEKVNSLKCIGYCYDCTLKSNSTVVYQHFNNNEELFLAYPEIDSTISPYYNCFGFVFVNGKYCINDLRVNDILVKDNYIDSKIQEGAIVLLLRKKVFVHAARFNKELNLICKNGVEGMKSYLNIEEMRKDYFFDEYIIRIKESELIREY